MSEFSDAVDFLDLNDTDPIYGSSFRMMIKEAFRNDKHFILAKLTTRGKDKFDCASENDVKIINSQISSYFNAFSILKLIFQKKNEEFIGRFHNQNAINAINPLTNARIIGEVEFYMVENPYLQI
jgi:hypothetical protein